MIEAWNFFDPAPWGPREWLTRSNIISITKSISKICIPNFVSVLTYEIYNLSNGIFIILPQGHAPRMGLEDAGVSKLISSDNGHMTYQIKEDDE